MTASLSAQAQRRVLLVDDDMISIELLSLLLGHDGHQVLRAADGESALDMLLPLKKKGSPEIAAMEQAPGHLYTAAELPDVLIVDLQMPGVSGYEVAVKVRAMAGSQPLLLAMSATELDQDQLQHFDGFLLKPVALEDLRRALAITKPDRRRRLKNGTPGSRRSVRAVAARSAARAPLSSLSPEIDWEVVEKLQRAMSPSSLRELYEACIADMRQRILRLRSQVLAGDLGQIRHTGHQIKGATAMVGAARAAGIAESLELGSCKEEDTLHLLDDLLASCDALERMLLAGKLQKTL